jgi:hypothetical protein
MQTYDGLILTLVTEKNFDFAFLAKKAKKANPFFLMNKSSLKKQLAMFAN